MTDFNEENEENLDRDYSRYLEFCLGEEKFGIPLLQVRELISVPETTPIPYAPDYFLGIMNLRGQVISIIDLRKKMKISSKENTKETAVIIIEIQDVSLGIIVDSINKVLNMNSHDVSIVPEIESQIHSEFISGIYRSPDDNLIVLMNLEKVLDLKDIAAMKKAAGQKAA